ncbi:MAG: response regulator, partial [Anaerolineaceae bacterium]|nr:response regulator [Anaerolineaceae bacterium]
MSEPLTVLIIEDNENDVLMTIRLLKKADFEVVYRKVETAEQMRAALAEINWDVIISDYSLPKFTGHAALAVLKETGLEIPFIVLSGTMGEETAVSMMKAGAQDYVMKDNLSRLVPAVERGIEQAKLRREVKQAEELMNRKDELLRLTGEIAVIGGWEYDAITLRGAWTDAASAIHDLDSNQEADIQRNIQHYIGPSRQLIEQAVSDAVQHAVPYDLELEMISAAGKHKWVRVVGRPELEDGRVKRVRGIIQDITERKAKEIQLQHHREDLEVINKLNHLVNKGESFDQLV